jgi:hypothetical protein
MPEPDPSELANPPPVTPSAAEVPCRVARCDRCGRPEAQPVDAGMLCPECFQLCGACCAGGDDGP